MTCDLSVFVRAEGEGMPDQGTRIGSLLRAKCCGGLATRAST